MGCQQFSLLIPEEFLIAWNIASHLDLRQIRTDVSSEEGEISQRLKSGTSLNSVDVSAVEAIRAVVLGRRLPSPMSLWSSAQPATHISTVPALQPSREHWIWTWNACWCLRLPPCSMALKKATLSHRPRKFQDVYFMFLIMCVEGPPGNWWRCSASCVLSNFQPNIKPYLIFLFRKGIS